MDLFLLFGVNLDCWNFDVGALKNGSGNMQAVISFNHGSNPSIISAKTVSMGWVNFF